MTHHYFYDFCCNSFVARLLHQTPSKTFRFDSIRFKGFRFDLDSNRSDVVCDSDPIRFDIVDSEAKRFDAISIRFPNSDSIRTGPAVHVWGMHLWPTPFAPTASEVSMDAYVRDVKIHT